LTIATISFFYFRPIVNFNKDKAEGIQFFRGNWNDAIALAKKENKLIFLDVYATWCGPCKRLKKYVFSDKNVGTYFNEKFINVTIDAEKSEGIPISEQFNVTSYPTLIFIDQTGKLLHKMEGYFGTDALINNTKSILQK
jgi:thioredoxin-related protein